MNEVDWAEGRPAVLFGLAQLGSASGVLSSALAPPLAVGLALSVLGPALAMLLLGRVDALFFAALALLAGAACLFGCELALGLRPADPPLYLGLLALALLALFARDATDNESLHYSNDEVALTVLDGAFVGLVALLLVFASFTRFRFLFRAALGGWLALLLVWLLEALNGFAFTRSALLLGCLLVWIAQAVGLALAVFAARYVALARCEEAGRRHRRSADAVWAAVLQKDGDDARRLRAAWDQFRAASASSPRKALDAVRGGQLRAVSSIFELFVQAGAVNPLLQRKAAQWAAQHGGATTPSPVKSAARAVQKAHLVYEGDFRRLCDLARCTIVFDNLRSLAACLTAVVNDAETEAVFRGGRKCGLLEGGPGPLLAPGVVAGAGAGAGSSIAARCGCRDVRISVQLAHSEAARAAGVSQHVCEVRLQLRALRDALPRDACHQNYLCWRSLAEQ